jgi:hypothetical protein
MPPLVDVDATDKMLTMSGGVLRMNSRKGMTVIVK